MGMNSMQANFNLGSNNIINLATPVTDGCNKRYVDSRYSNLIGSIVNLISTTRPTIILSKPPTNH